MLAALVLLAGVSAFIYAVPDLLKTTASLLFTVLLLAAVCISKMRKTAYVLSSLALLTYVLAMEPGSLFGMLITAYPLLLFYALLLPSPLYTLVAAMAVGIKLYLYDDLSTGHEWMTHLFFITLNAMAYMILAYYTRKLEKERNEYRYLSTIDSLTGLASLQQTLLFGQRLIDEGRSVQVLLMDLNFFKQINDTHGHMVGNKVILFIADYLRHMIKNVNGIAGRLGGDEFVIVLEHSEGYANIREKLLQELNGRTFVPGDGFFPVALSFSVGVSVSDTNKEARIEELLHDADLNMYEFKLLHRLSTFHGKTSDLIEHNPDPICTFDRKGKLIAVNPAATALLGYEAEEITRKQFVALIHPEDRLKALKSFLETMKGGTNQIELRLLHKEGHTLLVDVTNIPILADHQIVGIYGVAKDISDRKKAEEMLRNSDRLAVTGQLAAGLAHEIRNPLTALKGFIQLLQTSANENKAYYPIMLNELERINLIVNEFLLLSKPREANFCDTDIRTVIDHVVTLLDTEAILNKVQLVMEDMEPIPPIRCDENQMKQVFVNVLKNAIEAMPDGGEVTVRTESSDQFFKVKITDQGSGIPEELISRIGQPFFTTKANGTGLGLMICHNIMETHGGTFSIESKAGAGTTVEIALPFS
ncbi:ATP-binding protein [Paenibacillus ginsengarvi]|nr:ATP-binding protein [Paenibacillus ginsengarvi]